MIGVGTWNTQAEYRDIKVVDPSGKTLFASDFAAGLDGWKTAGGAWSVKDGALCQTADGTDFRASAGDHIVGRLHAHVESPQAQRRRRLSHLVPHRQHRSADLVEHRRLAKHGPRLPKRRLLRNAGPRQHRNGSLVRHPHRALRRHGEGLSRRQARAIGGAKVRELPLRRRRPRRENARARARNSPTPAPNRAPSTSSCKTSARGRQPASSPP